jgi:hypothetical protein
LFARRKCGFEQRADERSVEIERLTNLKLRELRQ